MTLHWLLLLQNLLHPRVLSVQTVEVEQNRLGVDPETMEDPGG